MFVTVYIDIQVRKLNDRVTEIEASGLSWLVPNLLLLFCGLQIGRGDEECWWSCLSIVSNYFASQIEPHDHI